MIGWLWRVIVGRFGCDHKWKIIDGPIRVLTNGAITHQDYTLQCERCGDLKRRRV